MHPASRPLIVAAIALAVSLHSRSALSDSPNPRDVAFFETRIRPVLVQHCYECHSQNAKELGGSLLLDDVAAMKDGGQSGPMIDQDDPNQSLILQALRYEDIEMPPEAPLPEAVIADFEKWIQRGAVVPQTSPKSGDETDNKSDANDTETLWSLKPVTHPAIPEVQQADWPRDPIDRFVLAQLESAGITPTSDAEPAKLARRLHIDLIGLEPSVQQYDEFIRDYQRDGDAATARLVDRLLASPRFGERWGRHWLDVARYGESNGNDGLGRNPTFPHAWRYRNYVIDSINDDTPYDQFLREQIAGDLMPSDSPDQRDRQLIATGFLAMTAKPAKAMNDDFDMDIVADQIDVVGSGVMGLSVACARCHDHKFDPVSMKDYYALAGVFTSTESMWGVAGHEKLTAPPTDLHVLTAAPKVLPPEDFVETVIVLDSATGIPKAIPKSKWAPGTPLAMGVRDRKEPADCKLNIQGSSKKLGEPVPRGFLPACKVCSEDEGDAEPDFVVPPGQSGRLQLAQWLTHPQHPLTARVMVNRIWMHLFGNGLVRTPNDFGVYGQRPSHPELLDHLSSRFVRDGWSIKRLVRAIALSRIYQLSSSASDDLIQADEENFLLSRHSRRRLDAETLRDSMLQASGQLHLIASPGSIVQHRDILVNLAGNLHQPTPQRSVYLCYLRSSPPPSLAPFDLPDFTEVVAQRDDSTVPGQALYLLNSSVVVENATRLAERALAEQVSSAGSSVEQRIRFVFRQALRREPSTSETDDATQFLRDMIDQLGDPLAAWSSVAQGLMISNEFRYVD
ncbi:PSD1 and planctomycete cytochrome C domain-containing protein [Stieleria varia]|uniref:Planctomycete cytochrome C n=1 Tax=Stieleria varia TaxID=2528005 RepID=A0A5C6A1Y6_9BACT|nr:PSD1 and planctomycete cytochrome C domain-containing protein [Stieleria varia]TWT93864.1 Planctomycete cytochrome C [Stieleria varia]